MKSSTIQYVYKNYQNSEYYFQHFKERGCRPDGRAKDAHREMKISILNNSVIVSSGLTIIIAELHGSVEKVVYSPFSKSFGKRLIDLSVKSNSNSNSKFQRNADKQLEQFLDSLIKWSEIEEQIFRQNPEKKQTYAFTGTILFRILGSDGSVKENALLALFILLWTISLPAIFSHEKNQQIFQLKLDNFYFPLKYCDIHGEIVADPTFQEEKDSNFQISFLFNLTKNDSLPLTTRHLHKAILQEATFNSLLDLAKAELEKIPFNIRQIREKKFNNGQKPLHLSIKNR